MLCSIFVVSGTAQSKPNMMLCLCGKLVLSPTTEISFSCTAISMFLMHLLLNLQILHTVSKHPSEAENQYNLFCSGYIIGGPKLLHDNINSNI